MINTGSGSGTCSTDGQQGKQVTNTIDDLLAKLNLLLDDATKPKKPDTQQHTKPRIQKIPPALLDKEETFKGFYKPKVVAIGPIHHVNQNPRLENGEKVKLKLAAHFTLSNGIDKKAALNDIMNKIEALKDCYQEDVVRPYDVSDLAIMFMIDGCAMLHFMEMVVRDREDLLLQEDHVNYDFIGFAKRDMFLLENQLPYQLLQLLTRSIAVETRRLSIERAIVGITHLVSPCLEILPVQTPRPGQLEEPLHLLDLLHKNMTIKPSLARMNSLNMISGCELLPYIRSKSVVGNRLIPLRGRVRVRVWDVSHHHYKQVTFRTAKELKSSGIMLKQSATSSMNGVSFHQGFFSGTLSLPSITVDDSSTSMLLNLIAYEMCPDFKNELEVTSYVCFLDSLIDQSEDVRELRQARILRNHLSSDEDVAKLINKMGSGLVPNPAKYRYIKGKLYREYKNMGIIRTWVADVKEKYFSNPWTFLAVCGALFGLVMSFIQAWYAVKSYDKC